MKELHEIGIAHRDISLALQLDQTFLMACLLSESSMDDPQTQLQKAVL